MEGGEVKKRKKARGSFASYKTVDGGWEVRVEEVAKALSKNWGEVPKTLTDVRAFEIHCLAKGFLALQKKLKEAKP